MRAIVQDRYGPPDVLELRDVDKPAIGEREVLVHVHAAGVDPGVWHLVTGLPYLVRLMGAPKARVAGMDVAGRVEAVGRTVTRFQVGDAVFGACSGSFAEYASAGEDKLAHKPARLSFEQAAAVPVSALTALQGLRDKAQLRPGQAALIVGAAGGVGSFAVQIAKALGAEVTGVCSTTKLEAVSRLGADHVVDYTQQDFTQLGRRYDVILDTAGNRPLSQLRRALADEGTLVIVGGEGGGPWLGGTQRQLRALLLSPFLRQRLRSFIATVRQEDLLSLSELVEAGKLMPLIDRTFPLSEAAQALRYLAAGHGPGKVVLTV